MTELTVDQTTADDQQMTTESIEQTSVLTELDTEPCPHPACDGSLDHSTYKGYDAVVCDDCATPAVCIFGDGE
ncbi:hypothetical protein [Haladaptatus sp. DJG-WS-42]|uniref:hypothetical protein n=1 Tax=Haladaptatus sp. DJG-WS-42 TaxID=3120516 RepID=UPI0030D3FA3F